MYTLNFLKSQRNSHRHQPPFQSSSPAFTTLELYPRMRHTELYRHAAIPEEYQVRSAEHPRNLDRLRATTTGRRAPGKIAPPSNTDMRVQRDSYFS